MDWSIEALKLEKKETKEKRENSLEENIDWDKIAFINTRSTWLCDAIPVVVQKFKTREILMLAYANLESLEQTLQTGRATFWSTSRRKLWVKGETSGNYLQIKEVRVNCEQNSLLFLVDAEKNVGVCHVKDKADNFYKNCFYRRLIVKTKNDKKITLELELI